MSADGLASATGDDAGMNVIFLRQRPEPLPAGQRDDDASGVTLAFAVDDGDGELARLAADRAPVSTPLAAGGRGERAFQVRDRSGVIVQLLDWNASAGD
jgi:uncharacterized glyoxalase superfamily protein PhnB